MKMKAFIALLLLCSLRVMGQQPFLDTTFDTDFNAQVKSVEEFTERFNGLASKPGLKGDSLRLQNILHLFDVKMSRQGMEEEIFKAQVRDFSRKAVSWPDSLSITDPGTIAEASCLVKWNGKNGHITLLLQRETTPKGNQRWGIAGVKGLKELGVYSDKRMTISPVDHEIHFMSLQDLFGENRLLLPGLRSGNKSIDELSLFFGLCMAKGMTYVQVEKLKFHFNAMPDYSFVIEEVSREGTNSGWLITQLFKTGSKAEKEKHIREIFSNVIKK